MKNFYKLIAGCVAIAPFFVSAMERSYFESDLQWAHKYGKEEKIIEISDIVSGVGAEYQGFRSFLVNSSIFPDTEEAFREFLTNDVMFGECLNMYLNSIPQVVGASVVKVQAVENKKSSEEIDRVKAELEDYKKRFGVIKDAECELDYEVTFAQLDALKKENKPLPEEMRKGIEWARKAVLVMTEEVRPALNFFGR